MLIRVRPGAEPGRRAEVITTPPDPSFVIHNGAVTKGKRRSRVTVRLSVNGSASRSTSPERCRPKVAASCSGDGCPIGRYSPRRR